MKLVEAKYPVELLQENKDIISFRGLNRLPVIEAGELKLAKNLASRYPSCLTPRGPRETIKTLTSATALFVANSGKFCYVDGTNFYYDDVVKGTVTAGRKSITELSGIILIFPDKKYYNYITNTFGSIGSGSPTDGEAPSAGQCPNMDMVCSFNNRVWGVKNYTVYGSKFNDPMTWSQYNVPLLESDSVYFKISSESGYITGIKPLENHMLITTNHATYEIYGSRPSNYMPRLLSNSKGCIDFRSMAEIDGSIFMLAYDGVNAYSGSFPRLMSQKLNETYVSGAACSCNRKYYISLYDGSAYKLYVYDVDTGLWHMEDNLQVLDFVVIGNSVYCLTASSTIVKFNSGSEVVSWEAVTDRFTEKYLGRKATSKIKIEADITEGSDIKVYVSIDGGTYTLVDTYSTAGHRYFKTYRIPQEAFSFSIKFVGTGDAKVYSITRDIIVKSDL
jgi:hypothetical protein